jgi:16S rRNA processing protein RimM
VVVGERERLIPYTRGEAIREVDLDRGLILVDWDPEF